MAFIMSLLIMWIPTILLTMLFAVYMYSKHVFNYFHRRGIPYEPPTFPFGNLTPVVMLKKSYNEVLADLYNKHKGKTFVGFFQFFQKSVLIIDRGLIKNVLVKDFDHFNGKNIHCNKDLEPLSAHLFALDGSEWKFLRSKLSPAFTSMKLRNMFPTIADVSKDLNQFLEKSIVNKEEVDCKDVFTRYGIAVLSTTAFGVESDTFKRKTSPLVNVFEGIMSAGLISLFRNGLMFFGKNIAEALKLRVIPKQTHDFILKMVQDVVRDREENNVKRNDFVELLIQLKNDPSCEQNMKITTEEIAAQSYLFILAGFETVANAMSFFLYEMAMNPDVQRQILEEVDIPEELTYDTLKAMEYLDMGVSEIFRKYGNLGFLGRVCTQDYKVPGTEYLIEKGTHVMISTHGLHWDPDLFPDPGQFIPERFNKKNSPNIKPFSCLPFGDGPRYCIGKMFGRAVVKLGLATLLRKYRVERTPKTTHPLQYEPLTIITTARGGIHVRLVARTTN